MIKKIILFLAVLYTFFSFNSSYADTKCTTWAWFCSPEFTINTGLFSVWWSWLKWDPESASAEKTINNTLWMIIQKLMIALWVISLFIMTIWAWYMILYHGEEEFLTKWKNIFIGWIVSLIIALSSYYIVNLVWYLLYN